MGGLCIGPTIYFITKRIRERTIEDAFGMSGPVRVELSKGEYISGYPDHYHVNGFKDGCPNPECKEWTKW